MWHYIYAVAECNEDLLELFTTVRSCRAVPISDDKAFSCVPNSGCVISALLQMHTCLCGGTCAYTFTSRKSPTCANCLRKRFRAALFWYPHRYPAAVPAVSTTEGVTQKTECWCWWMAPLLALGLSCLPPAGMCCGSRFANIPITPSPLWCAASALCCCSKCCALRFGGRRKLSVLCRESKFI